jgi:hypothetical protein
MGVDLIGFITILYGILMYRMPAGPMMIMFVIATLFQAAAAVKFGETGIPPGHLLIAVVAFYFIRKGDVINHISVVSRFPREGFWLLFLISYCVFTGLFFPRLFNYATYVYPIGSTAFEESFSPVPLGPSSGNYTQCIYIIGSSASFFIVSYFLKSADRLKSMLVALLAYTIVNIVFGILDLVTYWTSTAYLLEFIHNGNYTFHLSEAELGFKRIAGTFSETAAFANATLGTLAFTFRLWLGGIYPRLTFALSIIAIILLIFSTSTTGYIGLVAVIVITYLSTFASLFFKVNTVNSLYFAIMLPLVVVVTLVGIALDHTSWVAVTDIWRAVVVDKSLSDSATERSALNMQAVTNLIDTFGLGAGTGSVRTSSFPLAVLANIGLIGTFIYGMFLSRVFLKRPTMPEGSIERTIQGAARAGALGILIGAIISGALIDLGLPFFIMCAVACSFRLSLSSRKETELARWAGRSVSYPAT